MPKACGLVCIIRAKGAYGAGTSRLWALLNISPALDFDGHFVVELSLEFLLDAITYLLRFKHVYGKAQLQHC
jgi:hypothetical protein